MGNNEAQHQALALIGQVTCVDTIFDAYTPGGSDAPALGPFGTMFVVAGQS